MVHLTVTVSIVSYQLHHREVFLPPEESTNTRTKRREKIVAIHDDMDTTIEHSREECCRESECEKAGGWVSE